MPKIYLSPSMQKYNAYAAGNTTEAEQCHRIGEFAAAALQRCGFDVKLAPASQTAEQNVAESNAWGADYHVCIHTNAGGGKDVVVFTSQNNINHPCAKAIYEAIDALDGHKSVYGIRAQTFYEIKATTAKCIYIECEFHDNAALAQWIIDHAKDLGEAIALGFCNGLGKAYKSDKEEKPMERWRTIEDVPQGYRPMVQNYIDAGALKGKGDGVIDLTEDMIRVMEIMRRYFEENPEKVITLVSNNTELVGSLRFKNLGVAQKE